MPIDYSEYGIEFIVKSRILRGYGRCGYCGVRQGCENPKTGSMVVLTVHYLDGQKSNNGIRNLVPLCQACHLAVHRKGGREIGWLDLHREYHKWVGILERFAGYVIPEIKKSRNEDMLIENGELRIENEGASGAE